MRRSNERGSVDGAEDLSKDAHLAFEARGRQVLAVRDGVVRFSGAESLEYRQLDGCEGRHLGGEVERPKAEVGAASFERRESWAELFGAVGADDGVGASLAEVFHSGPGCEGGGVTEKDSARRGLSRIPDIDELVGDSDDPELEI